MTSTEQAERKRIEKLLWEWGTALKDCERRQTEIRRLMEQAEDADCVLRAQVITGMPRGGGVGDPTASAITMKDNALQRVKTLTDEINAVMARKEKLDAIIRLLPENRQTLLDMRYRRGMSVSVEIPLRMHISERTATYWMTETLEKIADYCGRFGVS